MMAAHIFPLPGAALRGVMALGFPQSGMRGGGDEAAIYADSNIWRYSLDRNKGMPEKPPPWESL